MKSIKNHYFLLLAVCISFSAYAATTSLVTTDKATQGLTQAIASLKMNKVAVPSLVPAPAANSRYFVSAERIPNRADDYSVSFDNTADCHGAQYCSAGSVSTEVQGNPTIYFNMQNQELTQRVILPKGGVVYYTPSHAMGSFWPGRVEWRCGTTLYTLSWVLPQTSERGDLLQMTSSLWDKVC